MKKIVAIVLCFMVCILLTGCARVSKPEGSTIPTYAMIIMPDGSIIEGKCSTFKRISSGYALVKIDGIRYYTNEWRIVLWEK